MNPPHAPATGPGREALVGAILTFLDGQELLTLQDIRTALEREIDETSMRALVLLKDRLNADLGWTYYPPDPLARRIHHVLADRLLRDDSTLEGLEHVQAAGDGPVAIFANHLSYSDANLLEVLLHRGGADSLASRLTAIAGPKIFTSVQRRFSSLCFGTVKVPQSAELATDEAVLSAREVAQAAKQSIEAARERLRLGDALVIFGEGTRSRTGEMQPLLPGVTRYIEDADAQILPVGIVGTEALFPIGAEAVNPTRITVTAGPPMDARRLIECAGGDRRLVVDAIGVAIAEVLPPAYQGAYGPEQDRSDARRVLHEARAASASRRPPGPSRPPPGASRPPQ